MSQRHRVEVHGYAANGQNMAQGARNEHAVVKQEEREEREERNFPIGPFPLIRIEPSENPPGVFYFVSAEAAEEIIGEDRLEIVATGESDTNGEFAAGMTKTNEGEVGYYREGVTIAEEIVGKGRMRVILAGGGPD